MCKELVSIKISGEVIGKIWMPSIECSKEFNVTFTPDNLPFTSQWTGLRDAVLHITNDGDFQSCRINWASVKVTWFDGRDYIVRYTELKPCKLINDCIVQ